MRGQASAAVAASVSKARLTGQIVDRAEVKNIGAFDRLTADELREHAIENIVAMGIEYTEEILEAARQRRATKL